MASGFHPANARQAILAFKGDVYTGLQAEDFSEADFDFAQQHLRMLSGLYGVLRPLDLMQPYRLEMGIRLENAKGKDLYHFWGEIITDKLNAALRAQGDNVVINPASDEYYKSVKPKSWMRRSSSRSSRMRKTASSRSSASMPKGAGPHEPLYHSEPPDQAGAADRF